MIRSEELLNKLVADLHFHNYMELSGDDIMNSNKNVVVTNSKKQVILDYIDDVYIDYFFRTHSFKPIIIPKGFIEKRYTKNGKVKVNSELSLCLNNIYDRYTFIEFILQNFCHHSILMNQMFPQNTFLQNLYGDDKRHGAASECSRIVISDLMGYIFNIFLESDDYKTLMVIDRHMQKDFGLHASASLLMQFNKYHKENWYKYKFEGFTDIGVHIISNIHRDFIKIKDSHLFGDYTIEEILLIYSLLVEKFKVEDDNISTFVPMFVDIENMDNNIVGQFNKFEGQNIDYKIIEPYIFINDLYLRFTSFDKSKAFTFKVIDDMLIEIQHFRETPITSVYNSNPLPLPYLYNHLDNNK